MASPKSKLTPKQKQFVEEYLVDLNASQAAIRAGYSAKTVRAISTKLLAHADIRALIDAEMEKRSLRTQVTGDKVLLQIARLTYSDPRKLFNDDNTLKRVIDLDDDTAAAVQGVKVVTKQLAHGEVEYVHEIKLADRNTAAEKLMRHLGLYEKDNAQQAGGLAEMLEAARSRARRGSDADS